MYSVVMRPRRNAYHPYSWFSPAKRSYKPVYKACSCRRPEMNRFLSHLLSLSDSDSEDEYTNGQQSPSEEMFQSFILGFDDEPKTKLKRQRSSLKAKGRVTRENCENLNENRTCERKCARDLEKETLPSLDDLFHTFMKYSANNEQQKHAHFKNTGQQETLENHNKPAVDIKSRSQEKDVGSKPEASQENEHRESNGEVTVLEMDMRGVDPDSINVNISREKMTATITAEFAVFTPFGPFMRTFKKVVSLPKEIAPENTRSFVTPDGTFYLKGVSKKSDISKQTSEVIPDKLRTNNMYSAPRDSDDSAEIDVHERIITDVGEKNNCGSMEENELVETAHSEPKQEGVTKTVSFETTKSTDEKQTSEKVVPALCEGVVKTSEIDTNTLTNDFIEHFNMSGFATDDIKVNIDKEKRLVEVTARREDDTSSGRSLREYYRAFNIPLDMDMAEIKTNFGEDDMFSITAPKTQQCQP